MYWSYPLEEPPAFVHAYVGGLPSDVSFLKPIEGCIRGMRVGDHVFSLTEQTTALDNDTCMLLYQMFIELSLLCLFHLFIKVLFK